MVVVEIDLPPIHAKNSGLLLDNGVPPRVTGVHPGSNSFPSLQGQDITGFYATSLQLPGLEITQIANRQRWHELLAANQHLPRRIVLRSQAPHAINYQQGGCRYTHDIAELQDLGVIFGGFPAKVESVLPTSPMLGKIHPGQSIATVIVPGQPDLTFQGGGFTGSRVQEHLQRYWSTPGKQLVVLDSPIAVRDVISSDAPFEFACGIM